MFCNHPRGQREELSSSQNGRPRQVLVEKQDQRIWRQHFQHWEQLWRDPAEFGDQHHLYPMSGGPFRPVAQKRLAVGQQNRQKVWRWQVDSSFLLIHYRCRNHHWTGSKRYGCLHILKLHLWSYDVWWHKSPNAILANQRIILAKMILQQKKKDIWDYLQSSRDICRGVEK